MSRLPARPCTAPGCPALVRGGGKCERHAPKYDDRRGNSQERGYDVFHRRLRLLCFERDNWKCVDCGFQPEIVRLYERCNAGVPDTVKILEELRVRCNNDDRHLHADHIVPIAERPDLRLELSNLATRCDRCHRIKTARELFRQGNTWAATEAANGHLIVLMGAPGAGKSTYAAGYRYVVATDALRTMRIRDQQRIREVFESAYRQLEEHLAAGHEVVFDTTAWNPSVRERALTLARHYRARTTLVLFDTGADVCCDRQRGRSEPVPDDVVREVSAKIRSQAEAVAREGWQSVIRNPEGRSVYV